MASHLCCCKDKTFLALVIIKEIVALLVIYRQGKQTRWSGLRELESFGKVVRSLG
jgi:hypothetical protein